MSLIGLRVELPPAAFFSGVSLGCVAFLSKRSLPASNQVHDPR